MARFEVQQCWNFFVTRNHLENVLVDTINYILTFNYLLCIILKSNFYFAHNARKFNESLHADILTLKVSCDIPLEVQE